MSIPGRTPPATNPNTSSFPYSQPATTSSLCLLCYCIGRECVVVCCVAGEDRKRGKDGSNGDLLPGDDHQVHRLRQDGVPRRQAHRRQPRLPQGLLPLPPLQGHPQGTSATSSLPPAALNFRFANLGRSFSSSLCIQSNSMQIASLTQLLQDLYTR